MRAPDIYYADVLMKTNWPQVKTRDGLWTAARPEPFSQIGRRFFCAWLVLTGKADALLWNDQ